MLATVLPWIGNLIFVTRGEAAGTIDLTPFLFTCTAVIAAVAVFRYRVLEPIPTLRDARIEVIGDGILILDRSRRVADLNGAAEAIIGHDRANAAGEPIERILPDWPSNIDLEVRQDVTLARPGGSRVYDVRITPIRTHGERLTGYVVLLRDVTDRRHTEAALRDSELRYRELVENARDLICRVRPRWPRRTLNRAGLDLIGYARGRSLGGISWSSSRRNRMHTRKMSSPVSGPVDNPTGPRSPWSPKTDIEWSWKLPAGCSAVTACPPRYRPSAVT